MLVLVRLPLFIYAQSANKLIMEDEKVTLEDLEAIKHFSKVSSSSQMFIGNFKKMNCDYFDGDFCNAWSWGDYNFSGLSRHFVLGAPVKREGRWFINPDPFFCALCPKWRSLKEPNHTDK